MKKHKIILLVLAGVLIFGISVTAFLGHNSSLSYQHSLASGSVSIKPIYIHAGNNLPTKGEQGIRYDLQYASGHYLFEGYGDHNLIYDGVTVATSGVSGSKLSANGLHYAHIVADYNFDTTQTDIVKRVVPADIYIDGQKKANDIGVSLLGISDGGQDFYYYASGKNNDINNPDLKMNGKVISGAILTDQLLASMSAKGPFTNSHADDQACEGQADKEYTMSTNGKHVGHICNVQRHDRSYTQQMIVDGKNVYESTALGNMQLTNSGHYVVADFQDSNLLVIDGRKINIEDGLKGMPTINDDASHFATLTDKGILIDGTYANLPQTLVKLITDDLVPAYLEFVNNTLYIYILVR